MRDRLLPGFKVGHWTDEAAGTGCTVVIPPHGTVGSCDVRGSAPGSRETLILDPAFSVSEVNAVLLTGGSALGLGAADGVATYLVEQGLGYKTPLARIPIVPAAVIYDLGTGDPAARPRHDHGYAAAANATESDVASGRVGAGTGATVGKHAGFEFGAPGGLGLGHAQEKDLEVAALAVVNPVGDVIDESGQVIAGSSFADASGIPRMRPQEIENTVLVVVATHATLSKTEARYLAARGSDGITLAVRPAHTRYDGDVCFSLAAPGEGTADLNALGALAARAAADAIRNSVR